MDFDRLDGQVIAISGAGRGIGRGIALDLAARGAKVVVNDLGASLNGREGGDPGPAEEVAREIVAAGGQAVAVVADIGAEDGARGTIAAALEAFGRIDGIVHAACVFPDPSPFDEIARSDYARVMRVAVDGAWGMTQAAWPHFKAQRYGRVVLVQSAAGFFGHRGMAAYSTAKSAMIGMTRILSQEGEAYGIRVNNLSPVAYSRAAAADESLAYMKTIFPPSDIGPVAALMLHPNFERSGLMLHTGGAVVTRIFVPETVGVAFQRDAFTPANIHARLDEVMDEAGYRQPQSTDEVGVNLFKAVQERDSAAHANDAREHLGAV